MTTYTAMQNCIIEFSYVSKRKYDNPFNDIEVYAEVTGPDGNVQNVPLFWAGGQTWKLRYSSPKIGIHRITLKCSDKSNNELNIAESETNNGELVLRITEYTGNNPLLRHGSLKVSENRRYLEHLDGTPFFWLGDTWWMGLCKRLEWSHEFKLLVKDRANKGFSVIQLVAGLYPDMIPFDKRGENEAGFPWNPDFSAINPEYFDMADRRIDWLVQSGLVPCILGSWGYYIELAGEEAMKKHWKYLVARYGAYPAVWCMTGEANMPFYPSIYWTEDKNKKYQSIWRDREKKLSYEAEAREGWTSVTRYLRQLDPYRHPITIHATAFGHTNVNDPELLDINMLQTGHGSWNSIPRSVNMVTEARNIVPTMPVIEDEVCYEGIGGSCNDDVQRLAFWSTMLSGASGYTYGADGIWQVNRREQPFGPSPQGMTWGNTPWDEAYIKPGSVQLGVAKKLLERYKWWKFEPHPEWCEPHSAPEQRIAPYAAGIEREVRIIFMPYCVQKPIVTNLEKGITYRAYYFDPIDGSEAEIGTAVCDENNRWQPGVPVHVFHDMLLVMEAENIMP